MHGIDIFPAEYFAPLCYANNRLKITQNTYLGITGVSIDLIDENSLAGTVGSLFTFCDIYAV